MENKDFRRIILRVTGARDLHQIEKIQDLWSGYGSILRYALEDSELSTVVVKHVSLPGKGRNSNSSLGHARKIKSYKVETAWYEHWAAMCDERCRIPHCLAVEHQGDEVLMVLEDLDSAGYPQRRHNVSLAEIELGLSWLAHFHATFMGQSPDHLWKVGTYWHLDTRPEELKVLGDSPLRGAAGRIDMALKKARFQTFVHGDAKLANFCFSRDGSRIAAVDFQYVGGGCGMKDVAYFISSCLYEEECEQMEGRLLDYYFGELRDAVRGLRPEIDADALEAEWRALFPLAWTDFHRFLKGWSPGHWSGHSYSEKMSRKVIAQIMGNP